MVMLRALGHLGRTPSFPSELPPNYTRNFGPDRRGFLQQNLDQARRTSDPELVRALAGRARLLDRQLGLHLVLRSFSLGAAAIDVRAALLRRGRALRSRARGS